MNQLAQEYERLKLEATQLAGGLRDLAQRATVYHHLYRASGGNHVFPLIAAHGALWAGGYFRFGRRLGEVLSCQYGFSSTERTRTLEQLDAFADAFRDINRRVCVDTYVNYHFVEQFADDPEIANFVSPDLFGALRTVHAARMANRPLSDLQRREVFLAHFLDEQRRVVGPAIEKAVADFDWPLVRFIALKPLTRFAYFPKNRWFWFRNFAKREERVDRGLEAFDTGAKVGWQTTEQALRRYEVLPESFFADSVKYFTEFRTAFLANCS